ncbi:MAG: ATP-binding protein [Candidatus Korarchaeota archaeon]|nr:ATP-binding protein [Candidatus Korarchaeota archaeon]
MSLREVDRLGTVVEVTTPSQVEFVAEEGVVPEIGDYVAVVHGDGSWILGMITHVERGSRELSGKSLLSASEADRIIELVGEPSHWSRARVKLLGRVVERGDGNVGLVLPRTPPPSGAGVYRAPAQALRRVFAPRGPGVDVGHLLTREDVRVLLDPNEMISRHLAVLAVTGAGKSNAVAVIVEKVLELNGVVLLFDPHSEYSGMTLSPGASGSVITVDPKINVNSLSLSEFSYLLGINFEKAARQYIYLRRLWRAAWSLRGKDLLDSVVREAGVDDPEPGNILDGMIAIAEVVKDAVEAGEASGAIPLGPGVSFAVDRDAKNSLYGLLSRLTHLKETKRALLSAAAPEIVSLLDNGRAVVVDMGPLGEDAADVLVGHTLTTLLSKAKQVIAARRVGGRPPEDAPPLPVMVVLEEAHILIPGDRDTYTRHAASRVAREGRKFGVGLTLVSQRPKRLDPDVLSQMINKIILKVVEPEDQAYVRRATEFLSEDLVGYLPSLNVGEAVIVGPMVRLPAIVKVDLFGGVRGGESLRAIEEWARAGGRGPGSVPGGYADLVR